MKNLPPWAIFHVPHDSTHIPVEVRGQFLLDADAMSYELVKMTDHCTQELFAAGVPREQIVRSPVSRLVVDMERFEDDRLEPMAVRGMGVVYTRTHDGKALRRPISDAQRHMLIASWYRPHHDALTAATNTALLEFGRAVVIDCHSFPSVPLPYELDQRPELPQICIGTDEFHTPPLLASSLVLAYQGAGFQVCVNAPFSGALVPAQCFRKDNRVAAAMIEVRRDLYVDEATGIRGPDFGRIAGRIQECLVVALREWSRG